MILAGGRGTRLNEHTKEHNKCMLKFGEKHLIEYSLENALKLAVTQLVIVVGHLAERIINRFGNSYEEIPIKYVFQREQRGLVHAIKCSRETIGDADFLLLLGDEFFIEPEHEALMEEYNKGDSLAVCGVIRVDDRNQISKTYSILFDKETKQIFRLIEKPQNPTNSLMGTGNILFKNKILDYIEQTPINQKRKEQELPDLIQCAIDDGKKVVYRLMGSTYVNVNTLEDITIIKEQLMKK